MRYCAEQVHFACLLLFFKKPHATTGNRCPNRRSFGIMTGPLRLLMLS